MISKISGLSEIAFSLASPLFLRGGEGETGIAEKLWRD
jgi:hypothetical protein